MTDDETPHEIYERAIRALNAAWTALLVLGEEGLLEDEDYEVLEALEHHSRVGVPS